MEICRLEHIHKDYRMGEIVTPLRDICLTVNKGDFIAIEGPSGIGKSTLLYIMGTLLKADDGAYIYDGKDISKFNDAQKSEFRARKIGFLFQHNTMIQALTLRENLIFTQRVGGKKDLAKIDDLLYRFGLEDRADFFPHQLSGGQCRRAMAARCLIHDPEMILADEPTNDLDEHWSGEISGKQVPMKCHWAGQAAIAVSVIIIVVGVMALLAKKEYKGFMVANAVAGVMLFLIFTSLIGVCASETMRCNVTKIWGIGAAAVIFISSLVNLISGKEGQVPD